MVARVYAATTTTATTFSPINGNEVFAEVLYIYICRGEFCVIVVVVGGDLREYRGEWWGCY